MINRKFLWCLALALCGLVLFASYNRPYRWWPVNDMAEQPIIKPFNQNGLRPAPEGSVALDQWDPVPKREEMEQHPEFKNPVAASPESLALGKALYDTYCWTCHGTEMSADPAKFSPVKTKGMPAANIMLAKLRSDEHIFGTITHGSAIMKRMSYHLSPEERWHVVNYIRALINQSEQEGQ